MCGALEAVIVSRFPLFEDDENDSFCRVGIIAGLRCGMWVHSIFETAEVAMFT